MPLVVLLTERYFLPDSNKALILEAACEEVHNTTRFVCSRWAPWGDLIISCETFFYLKNMYSSDRYICIHICISEPAVCVLNVTPCNLINMYELAEEPSACNFGRWRQNVPPNRWYILPDYAASHCMAFTFTVLRTYPYLLLLRFIMGTGSFPGIKRTERGAYHPPLSSAGLRLN
jgi:hypothetical protein